MSAARPTEVTKVAELLESELRDKDGNLLDAKGYAKAAIDLLDELRTDRPWWTVLSVMSDKWAVCTGPFTTDNQARKALTGGKIPAASIARINTVIKTWSPRHAEQSLERANQ